MWGNAHNAILTPFSRNTLGKGNVTALLGLIQEFPGGLPAGAWVGLDHGVVFQSGFVVWIFDFLTVISWRPETRALARNRPRVAARYRSDEPQE